MPATEPTATHEVKIEGQDIFVKLASGKANVRTLVHRTSIGPRCTPIAGNITAGRRAISHRGEGRTTLAVP